MPGPVMPHPVNPSMAVAPKAFWAVQESADGSSPRPLATRQLTRKLSRLLTTRKVVFSIGGTEHLGVVLLASL